MAKIQLKQTCGACPEQYDVFIDDICLGYMRLRHGHFYAQYRGTDVFEGYPKGDGVFEWDERTSWLNRACQAILAAHEARDDEPIYDLMPEDERDG